jgi:hypothetical protein
VFVLQIERNPAARWGGIYGGIHGLSWHTIILPVKIIFYEL